MLQHQPKSLLKSLNMFPGTHPVSTGMGLCCVMFTLKNSVFTQNVDMFSRAIMASMFCQSTEAENDVLLYSSYSSVTPQLLSRNISNLQFN